MTPAKTERAFELQGQIRERLVALQMLVADLEDPVLSKAVNGALTANTRGMARTTELLQSTKATDPLAARHHSRNGERVSQEG